MAVNIEVPVTGSFWEAAACDIDGLDSIGITDIDMVWGNSEEGSIVLVEIIDDTGLVTDVGVVVEP
jgi:hypothetical protein